MALETLLWREASLAGDLETFFARVGGSLLDALDAAIVIVRSVEREHVETLAVVRSGAIGAQRPTHPRSELTPTALARVTGWIEAGAIESIDARRPGDGDSDPRTLPQAVRDVLRGVVDPFERPWIVAPLASSEAIGVLIIGLQPGAHAIEPRRLAAMCEPIAAILATGHARRAIASEREAAEADKAAALARLQVRDIGPAIVGSESGLRDVMRQVEQVAPTGAPVLILGETGSGKEVVARAIHERSSLHKGPILRVNCGAISPELIDSELFGHERGSFTGAAALRRGWFERADGGTLFLDEIAELPLAAQVRLLRVLQDGTFERVGGSRSLTVDVRVVAATHRDIPAMVRAGSFREDLWYRINVFVIRLPPLRERHGDIRALADHFADRAGRRFGAGPLHVSAADAALLQAYDWPGNVRELSAVIERAAILGEGRRLDIARALNIRDDASPPAERDRFLTLDEAMRHHIERALVRCKGRIEGPSGAARLLALNPNTLRSRMHKLGMRWERFR